MNKRRSSAGFRTLAPSLLAAILLASCGSASSGFDENAGTERLSSCSIKESPFADLPFEKWAKTYHDTVSAVVKADIENLSSAQCLDGESNLPPPTPELLDLAKNLPLWLASNARRNALSQSDIAAVLLEYLRTYECAMLEYRTFILTKLTDQSASIEAAEGPTGSGVIQTRIQFNEARRKHEEIIDFELTVSRQTLNRTLAITGKMSRLRPMLSDVNCFLAASPDLRNQFGLAAEIGSCLARVRDAQGSLRDFPSSAGL
jgi:hypothetical protein